MPPHSAGILLYRWTEGGTVVLLVHPGGLFWAKRDLESWSIPKGEYGGSDDAQHAARREFEEELGISCPAGNMIPLGETVQKSGKRVCAWALTGEFDVTRLRRNTFEMEWPPHSRRLARFPEIDRAEWFDLELAGKKINPGQKVFLERLRSWLSGNAATQKMPSFARSSRL
jgi:predicted NUDIX family NTP pyrophosphohydrolase